MMNNIVRFGAVAAFALIAAVPARAQDTSAAAHKPGGLNKVARNVSSTMKKAGRDTKAEVHRDGSRTHNTLKDAGNNTKAELKRTTGIHGSHNAHPGGLNKVAHDISNASKKAGSDTKAEMNRAKSRAHGASSDAGREVKETVKKP